ncbi:MAG: hypothetical protein JNL70_17505 [Saprospiraceae bacterium]|nr:hypothetical protein [Saprospiraceae bacterium]
MKKIFLIHTFLLFLISMGFSQNAKSQPAKSDSTPSVKVARNTKTQGSIDSFPVPKKAALWSIIPGGGQIYNKKWAFIKVPIVYGALATTIYLTSFNQKEYKKFKTADYNLRNPTDPNNPQSGYPDIPNNSNTTRLREIRDAYFKRTQQMYILTGVTYLLGAAEAFTSAHLAHFDVNDNLSFRVKPSFEPLVASGNVFGLGLQLKF